MSVVSQRPRRQYEVLHWGHVDLQEYANGRFVSNNNIFTIVFFNTYYHKQINKKSISACNETFRQSSGPVYAHTPMRNVGGLRTFNPKLKDSAGGEVKNWRYLTVCCGRFKSHVPWTLQNNFVKFTNPIFMLIDTFNAYNTTSPQDNPI